jgi:methyl-accepting chemotaxis protein
MRLTIVRKLGLGFGSLLLLMMVSAVAVYIALDHVNASTERMTAEAIPALRATNVMLISLNRSTSALRGYLLLGRDPAREREYTQEWESANADLESVMVRLKEFFEQSAEADDRVNFRTIQDTLPGFLEAQAAIRNSVQPDEAQTREITRAVQLLEVESLPRVEKLRLSLEALRDSADERVGEERSNLMAAREVARWTIVGGTLSAIFLGCLIAWLLSRKFVAMVQDLVEGVQAIAAGDLTGSALPVRSNDEIGNLAQGFNQMVASLRTLLADAAGTSREVVVGTSEIASGAQQQLTSLNETSSSLNEITTTAEQFQAAMQEFADRANAVQEAANETSKQTTEGRALARESVDRIEQVRMNADATGESVLTLADQMQQISEITSSVNEIAEQTKLLALNASIEAARAGEEGRGFSVVATQVRELANQSKESAGRIEALIAETQKSMRDVVNKIEEGGRLSEDSSERVRQVTRAFENIAQAIEQTRDAMGQINTGARHQEQGITQLVSGITEIDNASKESLAAAEQTQKSIVAINQRIQSLNESIARFKT